MSTERRGFLLFDASIYVFKAYHALPERWRDLDGAPTHAVLGFARSLLRACVEKRPRAVVVAFDESLTSSFRNDLWPAYKANRPEPDAAFTRIFAQCRSLTQALGLAIRSSDRFEADDIIATLLHRWYQEYPNDPAWIASRDKDLGQLLLGDHIVLWDVGGPAFDPKAFSAKHGVRPEQFLDYQTLIGDAVDNVPGIRGVGPITAARLLKRFSSLDGLYDYIDQHPGSTLDIAGAGKVLKALVDAREQALMMREVLRMRLDVDGLGRLDDYHPQRPNEAALSELLREFGLQDALQWRDSWEKAFV